MAMQAFLATGFGVLSIGFVISFVTPFFLVPLLPITYLYYFMQQYYLCSSREVQRLDSVSKSPIYALFGETLNGITTIRSFGVTQEFIANNERKVDKNTRALFVFNGIARWLAIRLEFMCNVVVSLAALFCVLERDNITPGLAGLSLTYSLQLTTVLNFLVRQSAEVETNIVSVERIVEYSDLPIEAPYKIPETSIPVGWPHAGEIQLNNVKLRYRTGLDLVLHGITATIHPREKIGIVGRTGAGKSSLFLALFRMVEAAEGSIYIDKVNIAKIGLSDLRSRLAIIPQDPTLFIGTVRSNLDPFGEHSDAEVWDTLESIYMKDAIVNLPEKLEAPVVENGDNFSVGQRQLLCLGRALLRKSKILLMDEATASVDMETDELIQKTIREKFKDMTVLTIAHRINTILDASRVMVLERGLIAEFDTPETLANDTSSIFYSLLQESKKTGKFD
jgi:ABC-type multidrug transport system fused ATPase/permease subunit